MNPNLSRRQFVRTTATATLALAATELLPTVLHAQDAGGMAVVLPPEESRQRPAFWAASRLRDVLRRRGVAAALYDDLAKVPADFVCVLGALATSVTGRQVLAENRIAQPESPEAVGLQDAQWKGRSISLACGSDVRGLVYAFLELADRVSFAGDPIAALRVGKPVWEQPANRIRSVMRCFVSEPEDKPWFNDRAMWPAYLDHLAAQRFNRFNLSLGIGYDFLQNVTDAYFLFAYPFLLSVPGFDVRVPELPDAERDRNLAMLRFISEETAARGLQFQLGIWMHGYHWNNSPHPNYTISGLSPENHGRYCRAAMHALLAACPAITGVTLRVHGESGVPEGAYEFWKMVFAGVADCGRPVEIDMHAKGINQTMIDNALATGLPVNVSPKYWGEHLGLPYHQAEIRPVERPQPGKKDGTGLMALSAGSRSFTRYGYGDLMKENRRHGVTHRIWPGTQRLLLWGDPLTGAEYGRAFRFCDSMGAEIMEPLTFKGRRGSGIAGDRCAYADASLRPHWDWQKYRYTLTVWGRSLYNPDTDPAVWQRGWRESLGPGADAAIEALATASRILPIITTAHAPSAGNNTYWPEIYANQSLVDPESPQRYTDTPAPKTFGNVSPFDPQLFQRINDCAAGMLQDTRNGRYTPIEVAQWLEDLAARATEHWTRAEQRVRDKSNVEYRRLAADVKIQIGLGRFFAAKFRAGVLFALFEQSGNHAALAEAIKIYRRARAAWAELADVARDVYQPDITVGEYHLLRGHWLDRLPLIDDDIARLEQKLTGTARSTAPDKRVAACIQAALGRPQRTAVVARHEPPSGFRPGEPVAIELTPDQPQRAVRLVFRHVDHAERYETLPMEAAGGQFRAVIPAAYTDTPYPLEYYFEVEGGSGDASLYPGFAPDLANQPYFVVRQA